MIAIINKNTNTIIRYYESSLPMYSFGNNKYSNLVTYLHLVVPEGLASNEVKFENGQIVADLDAIKAAKEESIRQQRNDMLKSTDSKWIEYSSKNDATNKANVETDKTTLRDLMTSVQTDLAAMTQLQDVRDYDPISSLTLILTYEE